MNAFFSFSAFISILSFILSYFNKSSLLQQFYFLVLPLPQQWPEVNVWGRLGNTVKTENLRQYWSSLKHRKLISLCASELALSIRFLEIL